MNYSNILGERFKCDCGKNHTIPTKHYLYSDTAYSSIPEIAKSITSGTRYLIIADQRTYKVAGEKVRSLLVSENCQIEFYVVPDKNNESPSADNITKDLILTEAPEADLYIAVGSGVINDLTKWVSYLQKKPYITVPTAASMNGYASANVAASIDGLKVLFHADACIGTFVNPDILHNAPAELTTSGLGDVLAKSVSSADWKLNKFLFDDYYCQFSVDLLKDLEPVYLNNPKGIKDKDPEAFQALFEALFYSSIAMTITGTSSPASGGEHLISHTLDMVADRDGKNHDYHGRQVGVASILMAALYQEVMSIQTPKFVTPAKAVNGDFWGSLSEVVAKEYQKKLPRMEYVKNHLSKQENWEALKNLIKPELVDPQRLKNCLNIAGGAHLYKQIRDNGAPLQHEKFMDTVIHANQMRARFTILDIAELLGIIPDKIDKLIWKWVG